MKSLMAENKTDKPVPFPAVTRGIPEIHEHETHRRYKVIDLHDQEIERSARQLVEGSKLLNNRDLWAANFRVAIQTVKDFCDASGTMIRMALVDIRSNKILFYFVPDSDRYDLSLGAKMTELEVDLEGSAGIGCVETLQVPERSLERFAGPSSLIVWQPKVESIVV